LARLPQRIDELATRIDRGQLAIRAPGVERRIAMIESVLGHLISAIVFAALLFSGVLLRRGGDEVLAWVLMGASVVPLLYLVLTWRRRGRPRAQPLRRPRRSSSLCTSGVSSMRKS